MRDLRTNTQTTIASMVNNSSSSACDTSSENEDFQPAKIKKLEMESSGVMSYSKLSQTCDRYGISDRAAAAVASVVLHENNMPIIDKNKLRIERKKARIHIIEKEKVCQIPALYFDGRKDKILVTKAENIIEKS